MVLTSRTGSSYRCNFFFCSCLSKQIPVNQSVQWKIVNYNRYRYRVVTDESRKHPFPIFHWDLPVKSQFEILFYKGPKMTRRLQTVAAVTCMKLLLLIFNVIFWAAGVVLLFFGLWMKISFHYLFELSDEYQEVIPYIFIGAGSIILIVGFFSCCCIVKGQPALLYILAVFLSIVFLCELTAGISGYVYRGKIQDGFKTGLNSSISQYGDGRIRDRDVDMVQKYLKCCGVEDYTDWYAKWNNHSVPVSCCMNKATCHYSPVQDTTEIYTEGCYVKVVDFVNSNLGALLGGACGLAGLQLIGVILACCLAKYADKAKYEPVN